MARPIPPGLLPRRRRRSLPPPHRRIGSISRRVISRVTRQHIELHRGIPLAIRARRGSHSHIPRPRDLRSCRDIQAGDGALEDGERGEGLVEGDFVAALVDADEAELGALFDLAVRDVVAGDEVDVAGGGEARGADLVGDDFAAQPVAVVVGVAGEHDDGEVLLDECEHVLDGAVFAAVVAGGAEGGGDGAGALGEVLVGADGGLDGGGVEVGDVEGIGEGVGLQFADVVFVSVGVDVVQVLDVFEAEVVSCAADLVDAAGVTIFDLVDAVARAVDAVVHLACGGSVEGKVVVR